MSKRERRFRPDRLSVALWLALSPLVWAEQDAFRPVPQDRAAAVLREIGETSRANYQKIRTWRGQVQVSQYSIYEGSKVRDVLEAAGVAFGRPPAKIMESVELRTEFIVDVVHALLYSKSRLAQPILYKDPDTGKALGTKEDTGHKISIVTRENYLLLDTSIPIDEAGTKRIAVRQKTPKDCLPCEVPSVFDPRTLFGTPELAWEEFPKIVDYLGSHREYAVDGRVLEVQEHAARDRKRYRVRIPFKSKEGEFVWIAKTFDSSVAFNPVLVEYSESTGEVQQTGQLEYKLIEGAWVPSATVFQRFVEQKQQTYYEKRATFEEVRINQYISPLTFNITNLGLVDGDVFFDRVSGKQYVYRDGQLAYVGPIRDE